jgi:phosphoglycolate phosphatase
MSPLPLFNMPQAVLFDWDNTLVDTFPLIHASINHALTTFGMPTWTLEESKIRIQHSSRESKLSSHFGERWEEAVACYRGYYQEKHIEELLPAPGALSLLKTLQNLNIPMAIVSNKTVDLIHAEVDHLLWRPFFSAIFASGDAENDKPAPDLGLLALGKMAIEAGPHVWFVGDAPVDWHCAKALGCVPIPIGYHHHEAKNYPHAIGGCKDLEEILIGL